MDAPTSHGAWWARPAPRLVVLGLLLTLTLWAAWELLRPAAARSDCAGVPPGPWPVFVRQASLARMVQASGLRRLPGSATVTAGGLQLGTAIYNNQPPWFALGPSAGRTVPAAYEVRWSSGGADLGAGLFEMASSAQARRLVAEVLTVCRAVVTKRVTVPPGAHAIAWRNWAGAAQLDVVFIRGAEILRVFATPGAGGRWPPRNPDELLGGPLEGDVVAVACRLAAAGCRPAPAMP